MILAVRLRLAFIAFVAVAPHTLASRAHAQAHLRASGLDLHADKRGIELACAREAAHAGVAAAPRVRVETVAFGIEGSTSALEPGELRELDARIELARAGIVEWCNAERDGIEHGWTIAHEPAAVRTGWLELDVRCAGASLRIADSGRDAAFVDAAGRIVMRYSGLRAFDSTGAALNARFERSDGGFVIRVDARAAQFPIIVDPLFTGPVWSFAGSEPNEQLGSAVASAGDVDGDGYVDTLIGSSKYGPTLPLRGRALAFRGSSIGIAAQPDWTVYGEHAGAELGSGVAGIGDVNADGFVDVAIGARKSGQVGLQFHGRVDVYHGGSAFLGATPQWTAIGRDAAEQFGDRVAGAGDVDQDGYADLLVSSPMYQIAVTGARGKVSLFRGSAVGLAADAAWTSVGVKPNASHGRAISGAGDVNADGRADVAVGAPFDYDTSSQLSGRVRVYEGASAGLPALPSWSGSTALVASEYGAAVAGNGDADDDGFDDLLIGAPKAARAWLHRGAASGIQSSASWSVNAALNSSLGAALAWLGDCDGDDYDDWAVGAPTEQIFIPGADSHGSVSVYLGRASASTAPLAWKDVGGVSYGFALAGRVDVDGDASPDLIATDPDVETPLLSGIARGFSGGWGCGAPTASAEVVRVGVPANPDVLRASQAFGPEIGRTWEPWIDHTAFVPFWFVDYLAIAATSANAPTPLGTLLVDLAVTPLLFSKTSSKFAVAIPEDCALVGLAFTSQAASLDFAFQVQLTNALDLVVGTY